MLLYRINVLVTDKATREGVKPKVINDRLAEILGVDYETFRRYRACKAGSPGITTKHLIKIAEYLECKVDDLINPAAAESVIEDNQIKAL